MGLPQKLRSAIDAAIAAQNWSAPVKVGWDPTHVEPIGIIVTEAKNGKRPLQKVYTFVSVSTYNRIGIWSIINIKKLFIMPVKQS